MLNALLQTENRGFWKNNHLPTPLTPQEEKELFQKLEKNPEDKSEIRKEIAERNMGLVHLWAKEMKNSYPTSGLEFRDLFQEGNIGLMKAVDKYQWRKGFKFSTYANWWIGQRIKRALADQGRTIRMPAHIVENISKYLKAKRLLSQMIGRNPLPKEIASEMGIEIEKVLDLMQISQSVSSLNQPVGDKKEGSELGDFISDTKTISPENYAEKELLRNELKKIIEETLSEREEKILILRFGLEDGRRHNLQEVGDVLGITRERIRQIQKRSLEKLRKDPRIELLK
jgi:RNA polymerase primary sigma factor